MMLASQISVGNELLIGDTVNTNVSWIGQRLSERGIRTVSIRTVPDELDAIIEALRDSLNHADLTILTGGLGPTHDDLTKAALTRYFDVGMVRHEPTLTRIRRMFSQRGIPFTVSNEAQADVPSNCTVLDNHHGTAPGMWFDLEGKVLVVLPGVPREMKGLMTDAVLPRLESRLDGNSRVTRYVQISGIGESTLSDVVIGDVSDMLGPDLELAYLPHSHGITLRLTSYAGESADLARLTDHIRTRAAAYIHSDLPDTPLERSVVDVAKAMGLRLATAESCTGGALANLITNISGSSAVFLGGMVAYDNSVKTGWLDVPEAMLREHGAVSREVALHMAKSVAQRLGADIGLSTTGIAGPTGGTDEKPVGLVWIGFWSKDAHFAVQARFFRDRILNKERSANVALEIARRQMLGIAGLPYDLKADPA